MLIALLFCASPVRAESFAAWAAKAEHMRKAGRDEAALAAYTDALLLWKEADGQKSKAKALSARAEILEKGGRFAEALKDLSAAVSIERKNAILFHRRGRIYLELSNSSGALGDFYKAIAINPGLAEAVFDRARAYEMQGELKFAREDYRTACGLGLKKACGPDPGKARRPKPQEAPGAAPPPQSSGCRRKLDACLATGDIYSVCMGRAKDCAGGPAKDCCPHECLKQFQDLLKADESEAQAFRDVFGPGGACGIRK